MSLVSKENQPREVTRTIVDINMKEFKNHSEEAQDETIVKVCKSSSTTKGERYKFSTTEGVDYSFGGNIGAQVMGLAVALESMQLTTRKRLKQKKQNSQM